MNYKGFHGTSKISAETILNDKKFNDSRGLDHRNKALWLGFGVYLFSTIY